ncbi:MAG: hypothetical protein HRU76_00630 [Phycisphaeraceae bacterium]|nr:hypothetical protein [Phycisphaerales bacterium]QOJ16191.1 MAG: hypothetical protein HRU76_00630 [Phycisphaeraceae bacterium]
MRRRWHSMAIGLTLVGVHLPPWVVREPLSSGMIGEAGQPDRQTFAEPPESPSAPPPHWGRWTTTDDRMVLPVFDGAVVAGRSGLAVLGGFTQRLETTVAIQIMDRRNGWQPIGSQMLESRAGHTATPLGDGRYLIVGGVQGTLGGTLRALDACEVLDPFSAGSTEAEAIDEPMFGHTAHPLPGGRVAVVWRDAVRIFDGALLKWVDRIPLRHARQGHASIALPGGDILVIGGDDRGTIEIIRPDEVDERRRSEVWATPWELHLHEPGVSRLSDGRVFVVGGIDPATGRSSDATWFLNPGTLAILPGPRLGIEGGIARPAVFERDGLIVVVGGETVDGERRRPTAAVRGLNLRDERLWSLPDMPRAWLRTSWRQEPDGSIVARGGYLFVPPDQSGPLAPGIHLASGEQRLTAGRLPDMRD